MYLPGMGGQSRGYQHIGPGGHYGIRGAVQGHITARIVAPIVPVHRCPEFLFPEDEPLVQPQCNIDQLSLPFGVEVFQIKSDQWALGHPIYNFPFHDMRFSGYRNPSSSLASSLMRSCDQGGSKVSSTSTSWSSSIDFTFSSTSTGRLSATGQLGEVRVIRIFTSISSFTNTS